MRAEKNNNFISPSLRQINGMRGYRGPIGWGYMNFISVLTPHRVSLWGHKKAAWVLYAPRANYLRGQNRTESDLLKIDLFRTSFWGHKKAAWFLYAPRANYMRGQNRTEADLLKIDLFVFFLRAPKSGLTFICPQSKLHEGSYEF